MRRNGLIVLAVAVLAGGVVAIVLSSSGGGPSGSSATVASATGVSPACLPASREHTAALPAAGIDVSPAPETDTANPNTQISFLGVSAADIHRVFVEGQHSGRHAGRLHGYSQGDGASFVPDTPFETGERVTVHAVIGTGAGGKPIAFGFRVDTPYSTATTSAFPHPQASPADLQSFYTLPGVQAPVLTVTVTDRDPSAGDVLTTNGPGPGQYGPLIYTPQGRLVWFERLSGEPERADI
jgi:hypothetical protein